MTEASESSGQVRKAGIMAGKRAKAKKLTGPFLVKTETTGGYATKLHETVEGAREDAQRRIDLYKSLGATQVKEGAYLFTRGQQRAAIKVFDGVGKLVTHEVLTSA